MRAPGFPILYVDDDRVNRESFQYLLADRFQILTASHSDEALRILAADRAAVLLADQRMESGMSGVELCALARKQFPRVVRMLVTAYADVPALQEGINEGQISSYIAKPWNEDDMVAQLHKAIEAHQKETDLRELQLGLLRRDQRSVSSFVVEHLLRELCNPSTTIRDNLVFSVGTLPSIEAALAGSALPAQRRFRELAQALADASSAAEAMAERIRHFRSVETTADPPTGCSVLAEVVRTAVAMVRDEVNERARLSSQLQEGVCVAVDSFRVARITAGLLVDALESIAPGAPASNRVIVSSFMTAHDGGVAVETAGPDVQAVPPSTAFEPFPADGAARARGLGLAVIRNLVETARGEIAVHATGQGTLIRVTFPLAA